MNGSVASASATSNDQSACSFYLNLVVLDHVVPSAKDNSDVPTRSTSTDNSTGSGDCSIPENSSTDDLPAAESEEHDVNGDGGAAEAGGEGEEYGETNDKKEAEDATAAAASQLLRASGGSTGIFKKNLNGIEFSNHLGGKAFSMGKSLHGLDKSLRNSMHGISKRSHQVANKAGAYAQRKTMVNRSQQTLGKILPDLSSTYGSDLQIGTRFSQGKVTVLHVVLKPSAMSRYLRDVKDEEAAEKYSSAIATLESLGATDTMKCLEREMLNQVRKGLMEKLSTLLLQKMNEKESGLELECIALEEAEEARWLFTFMEFQAQMKS